jgi:2-keto-4-pentenoate hydratase/2-oxohepta-3-ene-1,7-dioic acid hydratase in catechol pathway
MMNSVQFDDSRVIPSKVVCVARNYLGHIQELGNVVPERPVIFIKPNSAITDALALPLDEAVAYEGEICFLIRNNAFYGVGFGLDLTKRAVQSELKDKGLPWERAKAFDGSAVLSEFVPFEGDTVKLSLRLMINGNVVQDGGVKGMINSPEILLAEAQSFLSLEDNDVLMSGTPQGVGPVLPGDTFVGQIFQCHVLVVEQQWVVGS